MQEWLQVVMNHKLEQIPKLLLQLMLEQLQLVLAKLVLQLT
jgi:hypothetical protein